MNPNDLKTEQIPIQKLITHESSGTSERLERSSLEWPVLVKPIPGEEMFYVLDGTNRVLRALSEGLETVCCVVGTPDFSNRRSRIVSLRKQKATEYPLDALALTENDIDRQHQFYLDTDGFSQRPTLNYHKGTVIKAYIKIRYGNLIDTQFCLPLKGGVGGLIWEPSQALKYFSDGSISESNLYACWGDDASYDPCVLPSFVEIGHDGQEFRAGGFFFSQAFRHGPRLDYTKSQVTSRGLLDELSVFVLYPDGNVFEGSVDLGPDSCMILWSDRLVSRLKNEDYSTSFRKSPFWWQTPTSVVLSYAANCPQITHSCGSTCEGGGCAN